MRHWSGRCAGEDRAEDVNHLPTVAGAGWVCRISFRRSFGCTNALPTST